MCQLVQVTVEEMNLLTNAQKTAAYLFEAICDQDFNAAQLELSELNFVISKLVELQKKRERKELLVAIVADMQERGIKIDFAKRASFSGVVAKNAVENSLNTAKLHKKRQQA